MRKGWETVVSKIVLNPASEQALTGIEDYSHLFVLFWLSRVPKAQRGMIKIHPKSRQDLPLVGVFATRTQYRPNPIGLTMVEVIGRKNHVLRVRGLDALNGTPIFDLKPISPHHEFPRHFRVPNWYWQLWKNAKK